MEVNLAQSFGSREWLILQLALVLDFQTAGPRDAGAVLRGTRGLACKKTADAHEVTARHRIMWAARTPVGMLSY
jgi:hypothetical protein